MKKKKNIILLLCGLIVIALVAIITLQQSQDGGSIKTVDALLEGLNNREALIDKEGEVLNVEPEATLIESPIIPGYQEISSTFPMDVYNSDVTIRQIGYYTGPFVEDGSNQTKEKVLGVILHNNTNQMMEACLLYMTASDGTQLQFMASAIPANADVFVLESSGYTYQETETYSYADCVVAYVEDWHEYNDIIEVKCINQAFEITNLSDKDLEKVYVCYKNKVNDIYFGGITYRVTFSEVNAQQTYSKDGQHFNMLSEVVYVDGY